MFDPILVMSRLLSSYVRHLGARHACVVLYDATTAQSSVEVGIGLFEAKIGTVCFPLEPFLTETADLALPMVYPNVTNTITFLQLARPHSLALVPVSTRLFDHCILLFLVEELSDDLRFRLQAMGEQMGAILEDLRGDKTVDTARHLHLLTPVVSSETVHVTDQGLGLKKRLVRMDRWRKSV